MTEKELTEKYNSIKDLIKSGSLDSIQMLGPKRLKDESYEEYKNRMVIEKALIKHKMQGKLVWDSSKDGTYYSDKEKKLSKKMRKSIRALKLRTILEEKEQ